MNSDAHDCCCCAGKMREGRHGFVARVGDEIVVIKDVPALICYTCGEIEYTLEVSREIDVIMKEFLAGRLLAKPLAAGEIVFRPQSADSTGWKAQTHRYAQKLAKAEHSLSAEALGRDEFDTLGREKAYLATAFSKPEEIRSADDAGEYPKGESRQAEPGGSAMYIE